MNHKENKIQNLKKMKNIALALLVFSFFSFLISIYFDIAILKSISEAAMVWAIADWFAVVAIFRHPLWLQIPHTALIKKQKDNIWKNLWKFIKNEFMHKENLEKYFNKIDFSSKIWEYLETPQNSYKIRTIIIDSIMREIDNPMIKMFVSGIDINSILQSKIIDFAKKLQTNTLNKEQTNTFIKNELLNYILDNSDKIEHFISDTIASWDATEISNKLELEIGKDLQFIRINWTIVWWLVWLLIYLLSVWFEKFL